MGYIHKWVYPTAPLNAKVEFSFEFESEEDANKKFFGMPGWQEVQGLVEYEFLAKMLKDRNSICFDVGTARWIADQIEKGEDIDTIAKMLRGLSDIFEKKEEKGE